MYFGSIKKLKEELIRDGLGQRSMFIGITSVSSVIHYAMLALVSDLVSCYVLENRDSYK